MKFFRKGISAIVLSSKLLLALISGLPLCSIQNIYAGPTADLEKIATSVVSNGRLNETQLKDAITKINANSCIPAQNYYLKILNSIYSYAQNSNPTIGKLRIVEQAFQAAENIIAKVNKSIHKSTQPFVNNQNLINQNFATIQAQIASLTAPVVQKAAPSASSSSNSAPKVVSAPKVAHNQPAVDNDVAQAIKNSMETAAHEAKERQENESAARKAEQDRLDKEVATQKLAEQIKAEELHNKLKALPAIPTATKTEQTAAKTQSTSSVGTFVKIAAPVAFAAAAGKLVFDQIKKAQAPTPVSPATPEVKENVIEVMPKQTTTSTSSSTTPAPAVVVNTANTSTSAQIPAVQDTDMNNSLEQGYRERNFEDNKFEDNQENAQVKPSLLTKVLGLFKKKTPASQNFTAEQPLVGALENGKYSEIDSEKAKVAKTDSIATNPVPTATASSPAAPTVAPMPTVENAATKSTTPITLLSTHLGNVKANEVRYIEYNEMPTTTTTESPSYSSTDPVALTANLEKQAKEAMEKDLTTIMKAAETQNISAKTKLVAFLKRNGWNMVKITTLLTFLYAISAGLSDDLPGHETIISLFEAIRNWASMQATTYPPCPRFENPFTSSSPETPTFDYSTPQATIIPPAATQAPTSNSGILSFFDSLFYNRHFDFFGNGQ